MKALLILEGLIHVEVNLVENLVNDNENTLKSDFYFLINWNKKETLDQAYKRQHIESGALKSFDSWFVQVDCSLWEWHFLQHD